MTTASDNFNRANDPSGLGSNWTAQCNSSGIVVSVNTAYKGGVGNDYSFYNAISPGADQYSKVKLVSGFGGGVYGAATVRASGTSEGTMNAYVFISNGSSGSGNSEIQKFVSGSNTKLANVATTLSAGDFIELRVVGTSPATLYAYKNGALVASTTDSSLSSGKPGIGAYGAGITFDDWEGGDYSVDSTNPSAPGTPATSRLTSTTASVSYSAASDNVAVTGYESSLDNSSWTDRGNNTSFTQTGLTPSTGATIYVRAYDAAGNRGSASSAAIAADPAPDVTDVDTDEIISFGQTGVVVTGTNMGGNTAARTITIEQGAVSVTQTQTAGDASSGTFNVVQGNLKTGSATLKVTRVGDSSYDSIAITLASASDRLNVDAVAPAAISANRLTATPDIETGDQAEIYNIVGGVPADITLNANMTFSLDSDITSFYFRIWSGGEWGTGTQQTFSSPVPNPDVTPPSVTGIPVVSLITASGAHVAYTAATDNVGVAGYEYSIDLAVNWVDAGNALSFDLSGLDAATDYTVMVRAYDASGNKGSARSAIFTTLSGADSTPPSQPGALSFSSTTAISTQVTWTAATDDVAVAGYQISLDNSTWTTLGNVLTATLSGLSAGTAYTVYVRAYDTSLNYGSARSGSVTTSADPAASGPIGQAPRKQRKLFRFF